MERKATAFVEQFSASLFTQWAQQTQQKELFWLNASFLQNVLEEGIAKLPKVPVKAHLTRDLSKFVELLRVQLTQKHIDYQAQHKTSSVDAFPSLLSEEDVERALATSSSDELTTKLHSVLALDDATAARIEETVKGTKASTEQLVATAEQCAAQLNVVAARQYEDADATARKAAFYMELLTRCVEMITRKWCEDARGKWVCDSDAKLSGEREKLRVLLQSLVVTDLATPLSSTAKPWTAFFQPQESAIFRSLDTLKARAGVYGALLALAVSFPVVFEDDSDSDSASTSSDSSSDSDDNDDEDDDQDSPKSRRKAAKLKRALKKKERVDCVALAKQVARQVVLAAKSQHETSSDWYQAVLAAFHRFAKPTKFVSEDEGDDEDDDALTKDQHRALQDALAELYGRAFTASSSAAAQWQHKAPLALLETLLCLRHAAEFMRVERKQTVPAIASATSQLVGVALPSAFWRWMTHVKKVFGGEHAVVQATMKKLTKHKAEKKMANVLMHDSLLSLADLGVLVEQFAIFMEAEKERAHFVVARAPIAASNGEPQPQDDEDAADEVLFFTDNAGGKSKKREADAKASEARKRTRTAADYAL